MIRSLPMIGNMAQQSHSSCVGKYLFSDPCEWLMMGKCPWPLNILSEKIARFVQFNRQEYSMSQQISALRQRLIDDMTIRNMSSIKRCRSAEICWDIEY